MAPADRQKRAKEQLRERILASARDIIHAEGYEAVTIRKIAKQIEYSPMALSNHFPDKAAILRAVAREVFAKLDQARPKQGRDPLATLRTAAYTYIQFGLDHPEEYRLLFMPRSVEASPIESNSCSAAKSSPESKLVPDHNGGRDAFERFAGHVEACCQAGLVEGDPFRLATSIWAGIHGVVALQISLPEFPFGGSTDFAKTTVDILLRGLVSHAPAKPPRRPRSSKRPAPAV